MPRPKTFNDALARNLPSVRVTDQMFEGIQAVADRLNLSTSDVVRGCIAHVLGFEEQNSELLALQFKKAIRGIVEGGELS